MSSSGLILDRPQIYGKQFKFYYVEASVSGTSVDSVKGHGFGTSVARPHQGRFHRTGVGTYRVTMPGDGGQWNLLAVAGISILGDGSEAFIPNITAIDETNGTIDFEAYGLTSAEAADPTLGGRIMVTIIASDWPHFS